MMPGANLHCSKRLYGFFCSGSRFHHPPPSAMNSAAVSDNRAASAYHPLERIQSSTLPPASSQAFADS